MKKYRKEIDEVSKYAGDFSSQGGLDREMSPGDRVSFKV
jgi:hypothetical protein